MANISRAAGTRRTLSGSKYTLQRRPLSPRRLLFEDVELRGADKDDRTGTESLVKPDCQSERREAEPETLIPAVSGRLTDTCYKLCETKTQGCCVWMYGDVLTCHQVETHQGKENLCFQDCVSEAAWKYKTTSDH